MFAVFVLVILGIGAVVALLVRVRAAELGVKVGATVTLVVCLLLAVLLGGVSMITTIADGQVGVVRAFGRYNDSTLAPGLHLVLPWEEVVEVDTRIQSYTFSDETAESISGPISVQAAGGGNLLVELTIQTAPSPDTAPELLRSVAGDWLNTITLPEVRSCTRDATIDLTVEEAYTTQRSLIGERIFDCVTTKSEEVGLIVFDVLIRDVDPGQRVKDEIDNKQAAEQELQRASIELQQKQIEAQQEAVEAFGVSQAEQIVACGGTEETNADGETIVVPNESCEDQFSQEYLQWLYINQLDEIDGVVIVPPEFDDQLFLEVPGQPADTGGEEPAEPQG